MTLVTLDRLTKTYPAKEGSAVADLSLEIASGELTALLGPSGCGKTTTMKMIAGLLTPSSGDVLFDGRSILSEKPEERGAVMVFQDHLLFPFMSVAENVGFGLKMQRRPKPEIARRVAEMLELVKLPDLEGRRPSELSGGQQQRIALARALIVEPRVLLLDEPLSNLDAHLRMEMRELIRSLQRAMGITTIFVTHDQEEAVVLADRVALMLDGRLKQYGTPDVFYSRPVDAATARFFGGQNFVPGHAENGIFNSPLGALRLPSEARAGPGQLTFRPENVRLGHACPDENTLEAELVERVYLGTQTRLCLRVGDQRIQALVSPHEAQSLTLGQRLAVHLPPTVLWVIP